MKIPTLKIDKSLPHHYLFSVAIHTMKSKNAGQMFLKHGPIYYTNDDVVRMSNVISRCTDKVYEQTQMEAAEAEGCTQLISSIAGMRLSANANSCTIHHFSSAIKFGDDDLVLLVKLANTDKSSKKKLMEAKI